MALPVAALPLLAYACSDGDEPEDLAVKVTATIVEPGVSASVTVTQPAEDAQGNLAHTVDVSWEGGSAVRLDDARFTHHVEGDDGDLVTAGRGCGASWDSSNGLMQACTADLQIVRVEPGETHAYPVRIVLEVGPLELARGVYHVEEPISWWSVSADPFDLGGEQPDGRFTIRLEYEVD